MDSNPHSNTTSTNTHNTHNPLTGDGVTNTHNPLTGDKSGPNPPPGTSPVTGRTKDDNFGRNEQQSPDSHRANAAGADVHMDSGTHTQNTHSPSTGDGGINTHNTTAGNKAGPNPPSDINTSTSRKDDSNLGLREGQPGGYTGTTGAHTGPYTGVDQDVTSSTQDTHGRSTGGGVANAHSPMTDDKTGPHPPSGMDTGTNRTDDSNLGGKERQPADYTSTGEHTGANTGTGVGLTSGTNTHNTHNPLTGDGVTNTHNPMTGDKTGPHPPPDTNPVTGRTDDGNLGRREQQPTGHAGTTRGRTGAQTTGAHKGTHTGAGAGLASGTDDHNTHNPLTGDGVTNTHNPVTGDKTGAHPPPGTNPVTGHVHDGNLGRNEQQPAGIASTTSTGTGPHGHATHDTTRRAHTAGTKTGAGGATGTGPTSTKATGGGTKGAVGRVEATFGAMIDNSEMHAKGVQKQEEAKAARLAKQEGAHGGANVRH